MVVMTRVVMVVVKKDMFGVAGSSAGGGPAGLPPQQPKEVKRHWGQRWW